jgi:hypothetical protein
MNIKKWFQELQDLGCIVCLNEERGYSPPDIHHIHTNGNRRVDDWHTIPLCPLHHRHGGNNPQFVSRHPWKKEFERRYGSEWDLYRQVQEIIESRVGQLNPHPAEPEN